MNDKEVGRRIKELRTKCNMTREQLAERLNITSCHVGLIERGERSTMVSRFLEISEIFQVSLDYLVTGCNETEKHCENESTAALANAIIRREIHKLEELLELVFTNQKSSIKNEFKQVLSKYSDNINM